MVKPVIDEFIGNLNESLESLELNPYEIIEGGDDEFTAYSNGSTAALITHTNGISIYLSPLLETDEILGEDKEQAKINLWLNNIISQISLQQIIKEISQTDDSRASDAIRLLMTLVERDRYRRRTTIRVNGLELTAVPSASILTIIVKSLDSDENIWYNYSRRVG